jgi:hypothetical protein
MCSDVSRRHVIGHCESLAGLVLFELNGRRTLLFVFFPVAANNDVDKQLYGFHPLRSLRNIFFGYRSKPRPLSDVSASKARSTENLTAISASRLDDDDDSGVVIASGASSPPSARERSTATSGTARDANAFDRRR